MADKKISALPPASTPLAGTEVLPIVQGGTTDQVSVENLTAGRTVKASKLLLNTNSNPNNSQLMVYGISDFDSAAATIANIYGNGTFIGGWGQGNYMVSGGPSNGFGMVSQVDLVFGVSGGTEVFRATTAGNIKMKTAGTGIDFSANTHAAGMTSELLNDYEEGTFTPVLSSSGTAPTVTSYTNQYGSYTKIGNRVFATVQIRATMTSAGTGYPVITGLPYSANGNCNNGPAWGLATILNIGINGSFVSGTTIQMSSSSYNTANDYCCFSIMYEV